MSPEVWQAAKTIIVATAADLNVPVDLPNEDFSPPAPPALWVSTDIGGEASQTIELGNLTWVERGSVWIHVMASLNTGIDTALAYRKAFSVAFRADTPTPPGLYWRDHAFDPMSADDGLWRRLSLIVRYDFDDRLVPTQFASARLAGAGAEIG